MRISHKRGMTDVAYSTIDLKYFFMYLLNQLLNVNSVSCSSSSSALCRTNLFCISNEVTGVIGKVEFIA